MTRLPVIWTRPALRDLERLDRPTQQRVRDTLLRFVETGYGDVKRLHGHDHEWRLRVGEWRIRFTRTDRGMVILRVLPRASAYR